MTSRDPGRPVQPSGIVSVEVIPSSSSAMHLTCQGRFCSLLVVGINDRSFLKLGEKRSQKLFRPRYCRTL